MYRPRAVLIKVVSRYLRPEAFKDFINELSSFKRVTDPMFVEILKKHFDLEVWSKAPIIKQDLWLHNYFQFEYRKSLKCTGLMQKYIASAFIFDDIEFYRQVESLNKKKPRLPKGVKFIPNEEPGGQAANHKLVGNLAPGPNSVT